MNNTVYGNYGPGILIQNGYDALVFNNISYGNFIDTIYDWGARSLISNNLTADPGFVNAGADDFRLSSFSSAIDAGTVVSSVPGADIDGIPRPQGAQVDIGAYEFGGTVQSSNTTSPPEPSPEPSIPSSLAEPAQLRGQCGQGTFTIEWDAPAGAQSYYLRVDDVSNNSGDEWFFAGQDYYYDGFPQTAFSGSASSGATYVWWVHAANSSFGIGPASSAVFTCP
jgi:hypothetical protein